MARTRLNVWKAKARRDVVPYSRQGDDDDDDKVPSFIVLTQQLQEPITQSGQEDRR
jgi:hypothetical protein